MDPEPHEVLFLAALLGGLIAAFIARTVVLRRTPEAFKGMREVGFGGACFGVVAILTASVYGVTNDRGGHEYHVCGPQTAYDGLLVWYGAAMILAGAATFAVPRLVGVLVVGLGFVLGGLLNLGLVALAVAGVVQLRAAAGDGLGELMADYPVLALIPALILVAAGVGLVLWPCRVWWGALRRPAAR